MGTRSNQKFESPPNPRGILAFKYLLNGSRNNHFEIILTLKMG